MDFSWGQHQVLRTWPAIFTEAAVHNCVVYHSHLNLQDFSRYGRQIWWYSGKQVVCVGPSTGYVQVGWCVKFFSGWMPVNQTIIIINFYTATICQRQAFRCGLQWTYVQFKLDRLLLSCWLPCSFHVIWCFQPLCFCPVVQMESGWGMMLHTPDRRVDLCLHSGHPPRPQLPPTHSNWVPVLGFEPRSSRATGFKSQLL